MYSTPGPIQMDGGIDIPKRANDVEAISSKFCEYWRQRDGLQSGTAYKITAISVSDTPKARPLYRPSDVRNLQRYRSDDRYLVISILDKKFNECDVNPTESIALKTAAR